MTEPKVCEWHEDNDGVYQTSCGQSFQFTESGPTDNGIKFCGYCGKRIEETTFDAD